MRGFLRILTLLLLTSANPAPAQGAHAAHKGLTCFFGSLHIHTVLPLDVEPRPASVKQSLAGELT